MNFSVKSLSWSVAALILLLLILSPFSFVTCFLIMTPLIVLYTMLKPIAFAAHVIPIMIVAFLIAGAYGPAMITLGLFFLVPSIVMGHLYKKHTSTRKVVLVGFIVILAQLLLELGLFAWQVNMNFSAELYALMMDNLNQLEKNGNFAEGWAAQYSDFVRDMSDMLVTALPLLLLITAFLLTIITHALSRRALRKVGIQVEAMPQAKTWRFPKSLVLYYLIAMFGSFFLTEESSGYWTIVISNLIPLLQVLFIVQAIGLVFFIADAKKWSKVVPVILSIPFLVFNPLFIIGLLDVAFPLRRFFVK